MFKYTLSWFGYNTSEQNKQMDNSGYKGCNHFIPDGSLGTEHLINKINDDKFVVVKQSCGSSDENLKDFMTKLNQKTENARYVISKITSCPSSSSQECNHYTLERIVC